MPKRKNVTLGNTLPKKGKVAKDPPSELFLENQINTEGERQYISNLANLVSRPGCRFLEVGSWCGDSTTILGKIAKSNGGHVVAVDWWRGNTGTKLEKIAAEHNILERFQKRIKTMDLEDTVIPLVSSSDKAAHLLRANQFDMIFIDGDHRYSQVMSDIKNLRPLLNKHGGILCGHDCDGKLDDFDLEFLEKGKDLDVYKNIHCGVALAVGRSFQDYDVKHQIWSIFASESSGLHRIDVEFSPNIKKGGLNFELGNYKVRKKANEFFALPLDIALDKSNLPQPKGKSIQADSFQKISKRILESEYKLPQPSLPGAPIACEILDGANIVKFCVFFYVIFKDFGEVNFVSPNVEDISKIKMGLSSEHIAVADTFAEAQFQFQRLALARERREIKISNAKNILEIGTFDGANALLLSKLFENSKIETIDLNSSEDDFQNFYNTLHLIE